MQYKIGTVSVTDGSAVIAGESTLWSANVAAGDLFKLLGSPVIYIVASVDSDTQITLAAAYAGDTVTGQEYLICSDFTANYNFPEISRGDRDWPDILKQAMRMIDAEMAAINTRVTALESA